MKPNEVRTRERKEGKESYVAPELAVYGTVQGITQDIADSGGFRSTDAVSADFIIGPRGGSPAKIVTLEVS